MKKSIVALVCTALLMLQSSSHTEIVLNTVQATPPISATAVPQIQCSGRLGTAFVVQPGLLYSADHVVSGETCHIPVKLTAPGTLSRETVLKPEMRDVPNDFTVIRANRKIVSKGLPIRCDGLTPGETYWAMGYAHGVPSMTVVTVIAQPRFVNGTTRTGKTVENLRVVNGTTFGGMSGGPVVNEAGEVVAIVDAGNPTDPQISYVKELKDTSVCRAPADK